MSTAARSVSLDGCFSMHRGGRLPHVDITFETWGSLNDRKDNVVLILTGLSPDAHAASSDLCPRPGWWEYMIGPGCPLDTDRYYVICINSLGSCKGSTGAASTNPATGKPYGPDFPILGIEDIAVSAHGALLNMGIERVHTLVGPSMGGMSVLAYASLFPDAVDNLISVSSSEKAEAFAIAIRSVQREAIRSDPNWQHGWYHDAEHPMAGIRLARKLGVISYRSAGEWSQRFGRHKVDELRRMQLPVELEFEVESYLEAHAQRFVGSFDPNCYLSLSHAMDLYDIAEQSGDRETAFKGLKLNRALVIGVASDFLFPAHQQEELAQGLRLCGCDTQLELVDSIQGHDAFLVDKKTFAPLIETFMQHSETTV